ncbi:MAG: hypothetical protein SFY69_06900 [Planctomycetota bacterium]|nr:hypothetical protein [Planctomycetota bacterium]
MLDTRRMSRRVRIGGIAAGALVLAGGWGCGPSRVARDAAELREVGLPSEEAMEAAAGVLATRGYQLQAVSPSLLSATLREDTSGSRAASTAAGAAAGGTAAAAGAGAIGGLFVGLGTSLFTHQGAKISQINVQTAPLDASTSAMRATAVVNGRVQPSWTPLREFWADMQARAPVGEATDRARAALPLAESKTGPRAAPKDAPAPAEPTAPQETASDSAPKQ